MQRPAPHPAFALLRCPVCRLDLAPLGRSLACRNGHGFDLAKSGYVNLMGGGHRLPAAGGEGRGQLARREAFLARGHFDAVAKAIARESAASCGIARGRRLGILDAGCGSGHHLARVAERLSGGAGMPCHGLGIDISKEAARSAARRRKGLAFAVADIWREWPVRSGAVDLLISVFAPKNFAEMARVLAPGGLLAIAYPGPGHLAELRRPFRLMGMREDKAARYLAEARRHFRETRCEAIQRRMALGREEVLDAILMGPNAAHLPAESIPEWSGTRPVTFAVELLFARQRSGANAA